MRAPVPARLLLAALACLALAASKACADAAALKSSMNDLDQLDPPAAGKAGVLAVLTNVRGSLANLKASAGSQWSAPR
ncbi:MAG TPA: hypothetical protein VHK02_16695 [Actinomycetota bacterium]|jgi:hypothetical protein|nr:hypothetical protein [Actinomycetota bacterium]